LGIIVAVLAGGFPFGLIPAGLLLSLILNSGIVLRTQGISSSAVLALTGVILLLSALGDTLVKYHFIHFSPDNQEKSVE
jgi:simple sugar transport system permease protein